VILLGQIGASTESKVARTREASSRSGNAATSNPGLVAGEMQAIIIVSRGSGERESILSLAGADYLIAHGAAVSVAPIHPNVDRQTRGQLTGTNTFLSECQNVRKLHRDLPERSSCICISPCRSIAAIGFRRYRSNPAARASSRPACSWLGVRAINRR
jgi:hypothetical protein